MATVNYSWNLPTVGGSEDTWGTSLNANWTDLDTLLGGVSQTEFAILDGATVTTAELNVLDGVTATTAELNQLDGNTFTADLTIPDKIIHAGDTDTSIRFPAADAVTVETAGSERVRVDGSGNVGIGTSSPAEELDVNGTIKATNVSDGVLSIPTTYVTNGSAKAWAKIDVASGTPSIADGLNTTSVVDAAVGIVTVNLTSAMNNDDFSLTTSVKPDASNLYSDAVEQYLFTRTTSSVQLSAMRFDNGSPGDPSYYSCMLHGDLA